LILGLNIAVSQASREPPITLPPDISSGQYTPRDIFFLSRQAQLDLLRNYSIIGICCLVVVGGVCVYFTSRKMLKPVDRVSSLATRISSTNLKERINHQGPDDELKRLADTFDDMLERLETSFDAQKQFIQDASHELRTPIAIAQTNIEVLEMDNNVTVTDYKRLADIIKLSLERMSALSEKLLLLSEGAQDYSNWSQVDMQTLIAEVSTEFGTKAATSGIKLDVEPIANDLFVKGDAVRLKQAIVNLVDNAIKYNRPGGAIKVSANTADSKITIKVQDTGIGISTADQQRIFDRFYRVDKSRSRTQGGSGLGLAIVKKIAEEHGGTVSVESAPGAGSTFSITLPRQKTA
jgi:signal transduction histidine kinase